MVFSQYDFGTKESFKEALTFWSPLPDTKNLILESWYSTFHKLQHDATSAGQLYIKRQKVGAIQNVQSDIWMCMLLDLS